MVDHGKSCFFWPCFVKLHHVFDHGQISMALCLWHDDNKILVLPSNTNSKLQNICWYPNQNQYRDVPGQWCVNLEWLIPHWAIIRYNLLSNWHGSTYIFWESSCAWTWRFPISTVFLAWIETSKGVVWNILFIYGLRLVHRNFFKLTWRQICWNYHDP